MIAASLKHPGVAFVLDGSGEESGDVWRKFYRDGVAAEWRPNVEPPPFSEELFQRLTHVPDADGCSDCELWAEASRNAGAGSVFRCPKHWPRSTK